MTERIRAYASGRLAAVLPAAALAFAALVAACAPAAEPEKPQVAEMDGTSAADEYKIEQCPIDATVVAPECLPIVLNSPPPPIHDGGEPYPHGTFPPELAGVWDEFIETLREDGAYWHGGVGNFVFAGGPGICRALSYGYVGDQLFFDSREELDTPEGSISAALRAEGVEFESLTVRTAEHYAQHSPETFYNWLLPNDSSYDHFAAIERLGAELHPDAAANKMGLYPLSRLEEGYTRYQVKLHGHSGDVRLYHDPYNLHRNVHVIDLATSCEPLDAPREIMLLAVGGLYTTFGDDIIWYDEAVYPGSYRYLRTGDEDDD